ncbi:MAG: hypothetical protein JXR13_04170 [Thalassovita sp.]
MGVIAALALLSGIMMSSIFDSDDDSVTTDEPELPDEPEDPVEELDTGATFSLTEDGVEIEVGDDETGTVAAIYYTDTEDTGNPDEFLQTDEARFYLVPEGVDWSSASWETQTIIPGADEFEGPITDYELAEFEEQHGLELLGVVDLMGVPLDTNDPSNRVGVIQSNTSVSNYYLEAETDGDELVRFLPEDYVITREGVPEVTVVEDTTGTEETEWLSADADGITVDGAGGNDILNTDRANVTLIGGQGDDTIESTGVDLVADTGDGDDYVRGGSFATVDLGAGNDRATILSGTVHGGEGDDRLTSSRHDVSLLYGEAGNDSISISGAGSEAHGGSGDDFVGVNNSAVGYGGEGDDRLQLDSGTTGYGGAGDDLFTVWNQFRDEDGPAIVTGGEGADTIDARVWNAFRGEADDIYLRVTDFDPAEDVLQVGVFQTANEVDNIELVEAEDGSYTDVRVNYTALWSLPPGTAVIRLEGAIGMTADQIVITS